MASLQGPEDGYDFVSKLSEDFFCPVTFDLLTEPYLTPCCGNHLSQGAVTRLQGQPCPVCNEPNLNPVYDKYFKRQVNELKVRCPNKSLGCEWVRELGSLDNHLSQNSVEGECQFVIVACPYSCGDNLQRWQLEWHRVNDCPNRPFTCPYCGHRATYIKVTNEHWLTCAKYPTECPNKSLGCQWAGEQGNLGQHLNESYSSVEGKCQMTMVASPFSRGDNCQICRLEGHKAIECPNRPFTCQYCNYESTYTKVTTEHWPVCKKYPLQCPNWCGGDVVERQDLEEHLDKVCPLQVVKCEFSYAGCEVECQCQCMQDHVNENMKAHLFMVLRVAEEKVKQQDAEITRQDSTITELQSIVEQQQKQITALMSALTEVARDVQKPLAPVFVPPSDIVMTDFNRHIQADDAWYSPPFYSHMNIGGHKMCLQVYANGKSKSKGTHVSVFVVPMKEEHDDQLLMKCPFRGDIMIQLLNQKRVGKHLERTVSFKDSVSSGHGGEYSARVERASGLGKHHFIAHTKLHTEEYHFLKNDCLKFRILNIIVVS